MRIINLFMKKYSKIPLEFDEILPVNMHDKTKEQIEDLIVYRGNRKERLGDYFSITCDDEFSDVEDCTVIINGNLNRVKYIGLRLNAGKIIVNSDVDMHLGAEMTGGHIIVNGDAESYVGREMKGGLIEVHGSVKEFCGASYMGEWRGMTGGKIIIDKNAGRQLGECMSRGEIIVGGNCDMLAAVHMMGGYIQVNGNLARWPCGQMKKGTILVNGKCEELLEGFNKKEVVNNPEVNGRYLFGRYSLYIGDSSVKGKAQIWVRE